MCVREESECERRRVKVQTTFKKSGVGLVAHVLAMFMFKYVRVTYIHGTVIIYWVMRKGL